MIETNQRETIVSEPKRENFKDQLDFELANIDYWFNTETPEYGIRNIVASMEARLNSKLGIAAKF